MIVLHTFQYNASVKFICVVNDYLLNYVIIFTYNVHDLYVQSDETFSK